MVYHIKLLAYVFPRLWRQGEHLSSTPDRLVARRGLFTRSQVRRSLPNIEKTALMWLCLIRELRFANGVRRGDRLERLNK